MITIEINGIAASASTEKEARKEVNRLLREARKVEAEQAEKRKTARTEAETTGYRALSRKAAGEAAHWQFYPAFRDDGTADYVPFCRCYDKIDWQTKIDVAGAESNSVIVSHYGQRFVGCAVAGNGYVYAIGLADTYGDADGSVVVWHAIGACGDQYALAVLPGITTEWFPAAK